MLRISFKHVFTLIKMQLKERFNITIRKDLILKLGVYVLFAGVFTAIVYLLLMLLTMIGVFGITGYIPISVFNVFIYFILLILIISGVGRFTESLFDAKDNQTFLYLPVTNNEIYLSKFVVFYINEMIRDFLILLPLLLTYGLLNHVNGLYYLWIIIAFIVLALFITSVSGLLSLFYIHVRSFLKKYDLARGLIILGILIGLSVLMFYLVNLLPEDLQIALKWGTVYFPNIIKFTKAIEQYIYPITFISSLLFGYKVGGNNNPKNIVPFSGISWLAVLGFLLISVLFITLAFIFIKPVFLKMSARQFEKDQKKSKSSTNVKRGKLSTFIFHEIIEDVREPKKLVSNYLMFIIPPISTLVINAIFKAIHTSLSGQLYVTVINVLLIILITCGTNIYLASVYSKDGRAGEIEKTYPIDYRQHRLNKALVRMAIMTISIIITVLVYHGKLSIAYSNPVLLIFTFLFIYWGHALWSLELDYLKPKQRLYQDVGRNGNVINPNEIVSFVISLVLAIIMGLLSYFFISESLINGYGHLFAAAVVFFVSRIILYFRTLRAHKDYVEGE